MSERIIIMHLKNGEQRKLTLPEGYTITFGPMIPGVREDNGRAGKGALRVYSNRGKDEQVACFTDVIAFRDASLKIEEKVTRIERKTLREADENGGEEYVVEAKVERWVDPDRPEPQKRQPRMVELPRQEGDGEAIRPAKEEDFI